MTGPKNTEQRNTLAKRIRELRTWPPFNTGASAKNWSRPATARTLASLYGPQTLEQLVRISCNELEYREESALIEQMQFGMEGSMPEWKRPSVLAHVSIEAVAVQGLDGEPDQALALTRNEPATDAEYAERIEPIWQEYLVGSLVSDDTDSQYQYFLKLKAFYENKIY